MSLAARQLKTLSAPQMTATCIGAGVVLAVLALTALYGFATPSGEQSLLQGLGDRTAKVEATAPGAADAYVFPKGAICAQRADLAARNLQGGMERAAQSQKLAAVSIVANATAPPAGRLQTIQIAMDANGSYAAALSLLRALADQRPILLLDRVDLTSMGPYLHLHVTGRAYCWSRAHL